VSYIPPGSSTRLIGCDMTSHTETQFQDKANIMNTLKPQIWSEDLHMAKQFREAVIHQNDTFVVTFVFRITVTIQI